MGLGSRLTDYNHLPPPEERDQSGSSVCSLGRLQLERSSIEELAKRCSVCISETTPNAIRYRTGVPCAVRRGQPQFPLPSQRGRVR